MDVTSMSRISQGFTQYATQAKSSKTAAQTTAQTTAQTAGQGATVGSAFELDISDAAKQAQQTTAQTDLTVEENETQSTKGLTSEEVQALEDNLAASEQTMLNIMMQALTDSNDKLQGWLDEGVGILNFDGVQIDASRFALPEVATNPEDAAKAVAEGGDWSVDAVSTRIFDLATAIAGGDPEKLSAMRAAVEEGFKQAGAVWKDATGMEDMPEITQNTYNEIMSRFDARTSELTGTSVVE
ncbi:MAG: hypothetical protein K6G55_02610 [Selenomonadaceae bacterium]|nr:hypothetical protein [Selenomonadaceae bacterium]